MITQTLTYNGFNFAAWAKKGTYKPNAVRKIGRTWTDANGDEHTTTLGWKYEVSFELNPMDYASAIAAYTALKTQPASLVFSFPGEASDITQSSVCDNIALSPTFIQALCQGDASLVFVEAL